MYELGKDWVVDDDAFAILNVTELQRSNWNHAVLSFAIRQLGLEQDCKT
jgi:hypothetical protein